MVGQSQTKLFKLVCTRAALMREPYRNLLWTTSQISRTNKKASKVHKTKQTSQSNNKIKKLFHKRPHRLKRMNYCQKQPNIPTTRMVLL